MNDQGYSTPSAVEAAIRDAARSAAASDPSITTSDRIAQEYFRRFLSRVFSDEGEDKWMLKGGTGILARVATARASKDIDLFHRGDSLEETLEELKRLSEVDLGDFFRFVYLGHEVALGAQQAFAEGYQVGFEIYIGANKRGRLSVDLVINVVLTDEPTVAAPANALDIPKLRSHNYRLYPVVDQVADKICATLSLYNGSPSSREWDLVDLVVLVSTEDMAAEKLSRALFVEAKARNLKLPERFSVPGSWGRRYAKDASAVPACSSYRTVDLAMELMADFIDPVLRGEVRKETWDCSRLQWR